MKTGLPVQAAPEGAGRQVVRLLQAAAPAGLIAGIALTLLQQVEVVSLIRQAEAFEAAGNAHPPTLPATAVTNIVLGTAYALVLAAGMSLREARGWARGLVWGFFGFVVFFAAPSCGLPPELPGTPGAPLADRQLWWMFIVATSAAGFWLLFFGANRAIRAGAVLLIIVPHLLGAPRGAGSGGPPAELADAFLRATALANAAFWLTLGAVVGALRRP